MSCRSYHFLKPRFLMLSTRSMFRPRPMVLPRAAGGCGGSACGDLGQHRRVVGGTLQPARVKVDCAARAPGREVWGGENVVDPQTHVALELVHPVVPPGERLLGLIEQPEAVLQAEVEQAAKRRTFLLAAQDLACPELRVVHVAVLRRDVVVAEDDELRVSGELPAQPVGERAQPSELVLVLL